MVAIPLENRAHPAPAFGLLHPLVQQWVWAHGWPSLFNIQEPVISLLLTGETDVLIGANEAVRTETAFLPICSRLAEQPAAGIRALYVSPLVDDRFRRVGELCDWLKIGVHISATDTADGILLATPESITTLPPALFNGLRYVVVDDFLDGQLLTLLDRLTIDTRLVVLASLRPCDFPAGRPVIRYCPAPPAPGRA